MGSGSGVITAVAPVTVVAWIQSLAWELPHAIAKRKKERKTDRQTERKKERKRGRERERERGREGGRKEGRERKKEGKKEKSFLIVHDRENQHCGVQPPADTGSSSPGPER